jgi:hypothetical protein
MERHEERDCETEKLYTVFAAYERKEHIESCPCCRGPESLRPLYGRPLRQLTAEDLHSYAFAAMTTMGDVDDFRHFLPRILELLKDEGFITSVDREVVLSKLRYGNWDTWVEEEQSAIREYLRCMWRLLLRVAPPASPYEYPPIGDWLCALARAEQDLVPYLQVWDADGSPAARDNLSRFVADHQDELRTCRVPAGYWEDAEDQWRQVALWVRSKELFMG